MEVILNGNQHLIEQASTLDELIVMLELEGKFAVEINENVIPKSQYASTPIHQGDNIEIVHAIGGG